MFDVTKVRLKKTTKPKKFTASQWSGVV